MCCDFLDLRFKTPVLQIEETRRATSLLIFNDLRIVGEILKKYNFLCVLKKNFCIFACFLYCAK